MTFGIAVAALILMYLTHRFPWLAVLGMLVSIAFLAGLLTIVWRFSYPDDLWYFWILVGVGFGYAMLIWLFGKAADDLSHR